VSVKGKTAQTNAKGIAKLVFSGSAGGTAKLTVTSSGYRPLTRTVRV
jgi:hypothetical protein